MLSVVVPLSRPERAVWVFEAFRGQRHRDAKLVIVENGPAVGVCHRLGLVAHAVLTSDHHQSHAKNEGIEWVRQHGGGWWVTWDDDDYHGPGHLEEIAKHVERTDADLLGQRNLFVRTIGGTIRRYSGLDGICGVHGSTICARSEDSVEFRDTGKFGEDIDFVERMESRGASLSLLSEHHYMLVRHASNTWQVSDLSLLRHLSVGSEGAVEVRDYGRETAEVMDWVDALGPEPPYERIEPDMDLQPEDSPAYVELMKTAVSVEDFAASLNRG